MSVDWVGLWGVLPAMRKTERNELPFILSTRDWWGFTRGSGSCILGRDLGVASHSEWEIWRRGTRALAAPGSASEQCQGTCGSHAQAGGLCWGLAWSAGPKKNFPKTKQPDHLVGRDKEARNGQLGILFHTRPSLTLCDILLLKGSPAYIPTLDGDHAETGQPVLLPTARC